jgi:hypothetical protein
MPGFYKPERGVVTTSRKKPKEKKEPKKKTELKNETKWRKK